MTNKNVIYIINCLFDDEWHRREDARNYLLKNREHVSDEFINFIFDTHWESDCQEEWSKITTYHIEKYAESVGADLVELNNSDLTKMNLPPSFYQYQKANWLKFHALKQFASSDYEKALYLDLDILVTKDAPDIFKEKKEKGFYINHDGFLLAIKSAQGKLKKYFGLEVELAQMNKWDEEPKEERVKHFEDNSLYNGGAWLFDRETAQEFCSVVPDDDEWMSFFSEVGLGENEHDDLDREIMDQDLWLYFSKISKIKPKYLGTEWNAGLACCFDHIRGGPMLARYFIHFFGGGSPPHIRDLLLFLNDKEAGKPKMDRFCSLITEDKVYTLPKPTEASEPKVRTCR